jgi:hypothetical protein
LAKVSPVCYNPKTKGGTMGQSKEHKIGELLANSVEDHWFNPASLGHYLSQQPLWTIDRVMEVVMWIVEKMARRYEDEFSKGQTSEGLLLAYNLDKSIDRHRTKYEFKNIKFPPTTQEVKDKIEELPDLPEKAAARWYREQDTSLKVNIEHPFI